MLCAVLTDLGLPQGSLLLALVAFNLGAELGLQWGREAMHRERMQAKSDER